MALEMLLSDWPTCGCMLSLLIAAGAAIFHGHSTPAAAQILQWSGLVAKGQKWESSWHSYPQICGKLNDNHIQIGESVHRDGFTARRQFDGAGLGYA
jgi:hypothetical protein